MLAKGRKALRGMPFSWYTGRHGHVCFECLLCGQTNAFAGWARRHYVMKHESAAGSLRRRGIETAGTIKARAQRLLYAG